MRVSLLWAMAENRVIGRDGDLPWRLPKDLKRFKKRTLGHTLIMGRRTWDSIGRPLPGRETIVVSRNPRFEASGAKVAGSLEAALESAVASGAEEVFVVGGAEVYRRALPRADRLLRTLVHAEVEGDVFFPEMDEAAWEVVESQAHEADARHEHPFTFQVLVRSSPGSDA